MDLEVVQQTRTRLVRFSGRYPEIARDSGLAYSWVTKFAQGLVDNPTIGNLSKLVQGLDRLETPPSTDPPAPPDTTVEPIASDWPGDVD